MVWISSRKVTGTFQGNRVLRNRVTCESLSGRLRLTSSLLRNFASGIDIGTANGIDHMKLGSALWTRIFSESWLRVSQVF